MNIISMTREEIFVELNNLNIKLHHKTGIDKLRSTLQSALAGTTIGTSGDTSVVSDVLAVQLSAPIDKKPVPLTPQEAKIARMTPKERKALRLIRVVVNPNDPLMSTYPGLIFTVGGASINNGRMIKKFVPFNNEAGWYVPYIMYNQIKCAEMQKFRSIKLPNGEDGLIPYTSKKYNVEILPDLTVTEMKSLAASQKARGIS